jgi:organic radical activating enzyme
MKIVLYGAGINVVPTIKWFRNQNHQIVAIIDSNTRKCGRRILQIPVIGFEDYKQNYADNLIFVTPEPPVKYDIIQFLVRNGVRSEFILNYEASQKKKSCQLLEKQISILPYTFGYCCYANVFYDNKANYDDFSKLNSSAELVNMDESIKCFLQKKESYLRNLSFDNADIICTHCEKFNESYFNLESNKIGTIQYGGGHTRCNCLCQYCAEHTRLITPERKKWDSEFDLVQFIDILDKSNATGQNIQIVLSNGEFFLDAHYSEIIEKLSDSRFDVRLLTTGIIYEKRASDMLSHNIFSRMNVSLDSGTSFTYRLIKGVDRFDRVINSLIQYRNDGVNIELKYIVLADNTTSDDMDGFVNICKIIKPSGVIISRNLDTELKSESNDVIIFAKKMGNKLLAENIVVKFTFFDSDFVQYE